MPGVIVVACLLANVFWFILFSPLTAPLINFWIGMITASGVLAVYGMAAQRRFLMGLLDFKFFHVAIGLLSAGLLYGIFFMGKKLSASILPFAQNEISRIYLTKSQMPPLAIAFFLFCWIAPAEEFFWRGFLQQRLAQRFGDGAGYVTAAILYALAHIYAGNLMLFMAALVCGLFWGFIYMKYKSLWPVIISHAVWDVLIFVIAPV